jgi:hypothetical protein
MASQRRALRRRAGLVVPKPAQSFPRQQVIKSGDSTDGDQKGLLPVAALAEGDCEGGIDTATAAGATEKQKGATREQGGAAAPASIALPLTNLGQPQYCAAVGDRERQKKIGDSGQKYLNVESELAVPSCCAGDESNNIGPAEDRANGEPQKMEHGMQHWLEEEENEKALSPIVGQTSDDVDVNAEDAKMEEEEKGKGTAEEKPNQGANNEEGYSGYTVVRRISSYAVMRRNSLPCIREMPDDDANTEESCRHLRVTCSIVGASPHSPDRKRVCS